jgi:hypothetical protein
MEIFRDCKISVYGGLEQNIIPPEPGTGFLVTIIPI